MEEPKHRGREACWYPQQKVAAPCYPQETAMMRASGELRLERLGRASQKIASIEGVAHYNALRPDRKLADRRIVVTLA
jgi:hypothetical protein